LTQINAPRPLGRKLADWYLVELRMTKNQVKKEVSEEEVKDPNGGSIGCFGWIMVALGLLIMLPTILMSIFYSIFSSH
jgi:hypothetical protein